MSASTTDQTSSIDDAMTQIDTGWKNWLGAIKGLDHSEMLEPGACGEWAVKDIAFHLAFWDEQTQFDAAFRDKHAGQQPPSRDWQALNGQNYASQKDRPPSDAIAVMMATHAAMIHTLRHYGETQDLGWAVKELQEHYNEHAAQVRDWRQKKGHPA